MAGFKAHVTASSLLGVGYGFAGHLWLGELTATSVLAGGLYCLIITFFAVTLSENLRQYVLASNSGRFMAILIKRATPVLPEQVTHYLGKYIEEFDRKLDPNTPADDEDSLSNLSGEVAEESKSALDRIKESVKETINEQVDKQADRAKEAADKATE